MLSGIGFTMINNNSLASNSIESASFAENLIPNVGGVDDEIYWKKVRTLFQVPEGFINLENGYFSPQPKSTLAFHQNRESYINKNTSWFMRKEQSQAIEASRNNLALF